MSSHDETAHQPNPSPPASRQPISDSPWFWLYLFATGGLISLVLITPKFSQRQVEIERQAQGRERAFQSRAGEQPTTAMSTRGDTVITLWPLYCLLGAMLTVGWVILWWNRFRSGRLAQVEGESVQGAGSEI